MKATPLLQKVCASGHFVRHSTYTGALMCNCSRGEKIRVLRRPPGPPSRSTRGGFGLFSLARFGDRESRPFGHCWLLFTEVRGETVWKIAESLASVLLGRQKAADRGPFGPSLRLPEHLFRATSRFSKQFRKGNSPKFAQAFKGRTAQGPSTAG